MSIKHRKRIEEAFGWAKTVGSMAQTVYRGVERVRSRFILTMAANNLDRLTHHCEIVETGNESWRFKNRA